jgi:hypothetical protein
MNGQAAAAHLALPFRNSGSTLTSGKGIILHEHSYFGSRRGSYPVCRCPVRSRDAPQEGCLSEKRTISGFAKTLRVLLSFGSAMHVSSGSLS